MSITQTFHLAHRARGKLSFEASRSDHNLRVLVGHANLLDSLMLHLADAEAEQDRWLNHTVDAEARERVLQRMMADAQDDGERDDEDYGSLAADYESDSESESEDGDNDINTWGGDDNCEFEMVGVNYLRESGSRIRSRRHHREPVVTVAELSGDEDDEEVEDPEEEKDVCQDNDKMPQTTQNVDTDDETEDDEDDEDDEGMFQLTRTTSRRPPSLCSDISDEDEDDCHPPSPPQLSNYHHHHHPPLTKKERMQQISSYFVDPAPHHRHDPSAANQRDGILFRDSLIPAMISSF